jgi:hypothetical protein
VKKRRVFFTQNVKKHPALFHPGVISTFQAFFIPACHTGAEEHLCGDLAFF